MSLSVLVRTSAAGVLAALLVVGCGGGSSSSSGQSYKVSVTVSGLSGTVVVAQGSSTLTFTADGTNTFSGTLPVGSTYAVTVSTQPATQYCTVNNSAGLIGSDVMVVVSCSASAGGIWTEQGGNDTYVAMADESGDFWLLDTSNTSGDVYVYGGSLTVSGTNVSGTDSGEALTGTFADGSAYGNGTMSGTVNARNTLALTSAFTTTKPSQLPQTPLALTYNSLYSQGSSLADISAGGGVYQQGTTTFSFSSGGVLFAEDTVTHCVLNGTVGPIASAYDMYNISYTYANCTGSSNTPLNGLTFTGIGALAPPNSSLNPSNAAQFIAVTAASLTTGYVYAALDLTLQ